MENKKDVFLILMIALVVFHIFALHEVGAGNPEGVDIEEYIDDDGVPLDSVPFFPYKVLSAMPAIGVFVDSASSINAGISADKFGAPFAYGMPNFIAAYA